MAEIARRIASENYYNNYFDRNRHRNYREHENYFQELDEVDFKTRFRLSKQSCLYILDEIKKDLEYPSYRNHPLSPMNQLLLTLRFLATGCQQLCVADFSGVSQPTASRVIQKVCKAICSIRRRHIHFPATNTEIRKQMLINYKVASFPQCLGLIDCTHIRIQSPGGDEAEMFRNRKGYFSINVQVISNANLEFLDIVARWPGSAHDSTIFNACLSKAKFEEGRCGDAVLLGDKGYALSRYMMTPFDRPSAGGEMLYNESHIRTRNCIERLFGVWKRRFPVLALGLRLSIPNVLAVIPATAVLHNILRRNNDGPPADDPSLPLPMRWSELLEEGSMPSMQGSQVRLGHSMRTTIVENYFSPLSV